MLPSIEIILIFWPVCCNSLRITPVRLHASASMLTPWLAALHPLALGLRRAIRLRAGNIFQPEDTGCGQTGRPDTHCSVASSFLSSALQTPRRPFGLPVHQQVFFGC